MGRPSTKQRGEYIPDNEESYHVGALAEREKPEIDEEQEKRVFKLVNQEIQGTMALDLQDDIYDPVKKTKRRARVLRGVDTIWADEQKGIDKDYISKNKVSLEFQGGEVEVLKHETEILKFMDVTNIVVENNTGIPKKVMVTEYNPRKAAEREIESKLKLAEAMKVAYDADMEQILPHASYLGIRFQDKHGLKFDDKAIRNQYIMKAMENPEGFLNSLNSPQTQVAFKVRSALMNGTIDLGRMVGDAYWTDGGFICKIPSDKQPADYLTEYGMMQNPDSVKFRHQLETLIK